MGKLTGLILAAGLGSRFGATTNHTNKCLHKVGGTPLVVDICKKLKKAGVSEIFIVVGHQAKKVEENVNGHATVLLNPDYANTSVLASVLISEPYLSGKSFIFTTGDHYFDQHVADECLKPTKGIRFIQQIKKNYTEEDSKVCLTESGSFLFGKDININNAIGEFGGMAYLNEHASRSFFNSATHLIHGDKKYIMDVFNALIKQNEILFEASIVAEEARTEIDHVHDLLRARKFQKQHNSNT